MADSFVSPRRNTLDRKDFQAKSTMKRADRTAMLVANILDERSPPNSSRYLELLVQGDAVRLLKLTRMVIDKNDIDKDEEACPPVTRSVSTRTKAVNLDRCVTHSTQVTPDNPPIEFKLCVRKLESAFLILPWKI